MGSTHINWNSPFLGPHKHKRLCCTNLPEDDISVGAVPLRLLPTLQQHNGTTGDVLALPQALTQTLTVEGKQLHRHTQTIGPHTEAGSAVGKHTGYCVLTRN